eukprot:gene8611-51336_t
MGVVSCGRSWTVVGAFTGHPDHSLWGSGTERLYVHQGCVSRGVATPAPCAHRGQGFRSLACAPSPRPKRGRQKPTPAPDAARWEEFSNLAVCEFIIT